jgi:hypothetical protein
MTTATRTRKTRPRKTRKTTEERRAQVAALADRLEEFKGDLDEAGAAEIFARFDGYSERNAMLIAMQRPGATDVSGFKAWQGRGRSVMPGETGIQILAPAGTEKLAEPEEAPAPGEITVKPRQFFRLAYVFDVAQTEPLEVAQARWAARRAEIQAAADDAAEAEYDDQEAA